MCGICGVITSSEQFEIKSMLQAIHHRGPDDYGFMSKDDVSIGMTRLAILDLSDIAKQPMSNDDESVWLVYNGETYNYKTEKEILVKLGYSFKSTSDTEVVLKMYEHYGEDFLKRMRGMFALAIYDTRDGRKDLLIARDQLGIKPLLYSYQNGKLVFASEMKSLLASGMVKPEMDLKSLDLLLRWGSITQPRTAIKGVKMLLPGHKIKISKGKFSIEKYWEIKTNRIPELGRMSYQDQLEFMKIKLLEAVQLQMVSDVPLGAFLSGGVDSSLLVALMSQFSSHKVKTFSVGFIGKNTEVDERAAAKIIANHIGTDHSEVLVNGKDVLNNYNHFIKAIDQPSVDGLNSYFVSQAARKDVTVAISGTGGDELFAGYPWYLRLLNHQNIFHNTPFKSHLNKQWGGLFTGKLTEPFMKYPIGKYLEYFGGQKDILHKYDQSYKIFGRSGSHSLLSEKLKNQLGSDFKKHIHRSSMDELATEKNLFKRISAMDLRGYTLNQLMRDIDTVSMSHSLEIRVPFLDHLLVDASLSLPISAQMNNTNSINNFRDPSYHESGIKKLLVDMGHDLLPHDIGKQKKQGFGLPFDSWLKTDLHDLMQDALSEESVKNRGYFNIKNVEKIRTNFVNNKISWVYPWLLMIIEHWARDVLD
jgi:asparagine synthase (glutamine-hydrolysing)